ncbi:hypothetical protein G9A89_003697 [Geosiphon pyriformis]|nr:hypothetical protein G9A89_003697 [Geosiphon pyriformis]
MNAGTSTDGPRPKVPGEKISWVTSILETETGATQSFEPIQKISEHFCHFPFYAHDMNRQIEAYQYCTHLNEDFLQCVIYDSNDKNARLIGVEYIINARGFLNLPDEERKYWHSHVYEAQSGLLITPMSPLVPTVVANYAENKEMEELINTYGKFWQLWQVDRGDELPIGPAQLMMSPLKDDQVDMAKVLKRDQKFNISMAEKRKQHEYLFPKYHAVPGSDHWANRDDGMAYQVDMVLVAQKKKTGT